MVVSDGPVLLCLAPVNSEAARITPEIPMNIKGYVILVPLDGGPPQKNL